MPLGVGVGKGGRGGQGGVKGCTSGGVSVPCMRGHVRVTVGDSGLCWRGVGILFRACTFLSFCLMSSDAKEHIRDNKTSLFWM